MRRLADRFSNAAGSCRSMADLRLLLADAAAELGFRYFALLDHASLCHPGKPYIRVDNYPEEWSAEIEARGYHRVDPVHRASRRAVRGFEWRDLGRLIRLGAAQAGILERSRHFGLGEGLTIPINVPAEPAGSCSFVVPRGADLPRERLHCAELVGAFAFEAARRLAEIPRPADPPHLSRRELQCLRLVAAGKSDAEIALILGIAAETARQYVKRARAAYDVVTRTQLVVLSLRDQSISFEEALDPRH